VSITAPVIARAVVREATCGARGLRAACKRHNQSLSIHITLKLTARVNYVPEPLFLDSARQINSNDFCSLEKQHRATATSMDVAISN
jgi:hypothetical protein